MYWGQLNRQQLSNSLIQLTINSSLRFGSVVDASMQVLWWAGHAVTAVCPMTSWRNERWRRRSRHVPETLMMNQISYDIILSNLFCINGDDDASSSFLRRMRGLWLPLVLRGGGSGLRCLSYMFGTALDGIFITVTWGGDWANGFVAIDERIGETVARDLIFSFSLLAGCSELNRDFM